MTLFIINLILLACSIKFSFLLVFSVEYFLSPTIEKPISIAEANQRVADLVESKKFNNDIRYIEIKKTDEKKADIHSIYLFFYGPESALWNGRIVPFFNLAIIILFFNLLQYDIKNLTKKEKIIQEITDNNITPNIP